MNEVGGLGSGFKIRRGQNSDEQHSKKFLHKSQHTRHQTWVGFPTDRAPFFWGVGVAQEGLRHVGVRIGPPVTEFMPGIEAGLVFNWGYYGTQYWV